MTITKLELVVLACLGLMLASCSRTHSELGGDSSTHWLLSCRDDAQCGGLACVCGVCSKECSGEKQCGSFGARASCVPSPDGCGEIQLCDAACARAEDCGGDMACVDGRCRSSDRADPGVQESGASDAQAESDSSSQAEREAGEGQPIPSLDAAAALPDAASGGATNACKPQKATSLSPECILGLFVPLWAWNGAACDEVTCGCEGADCAAAFPSKTACEAAYATCLNPETQCSGLPWYRCADHCPGDLRLIGGGRSSGGCTGDCSFTLSFESPPAGGSSCLTVRGEVLIEGTIRRIAYFELSDKGMEELMLLSRAIQGLALESIAGGAPDQTRHSIVRGGEGAGEFSYPQAQPPLELRGADQFVQSLIDQATLCRGDKLKSCYVDRLTNALPLPVCGEGRRFAESTCSCSIGLAELKALDGTGCTESCTHCRAPASDCHAECTQPCAGGPPVWDVVGCNE